jgi:hypothetical protein
MKEKMYDINPPQEEEKEVRKESRKKEGGFGKFLGGALLVIILAILGVWVFVSANTVEVSLWPTLSDFSVNTDISFTTEESEDAILMESFEYEEDISKSFESPSMDIGEKATGIIKVYNKYSNSITLVSGTRFLSSTEPTKQFHTLKKISVPSGGNVEVSVIASEAGDSYNIEAATFSVPGLRDFSPAQLYYDVYGKSEAVMTGGRQEIIKKIEEGTFQATEEKMLEDARKDMITKISEKIEPDYVLLKDTLKIELLDSGAIDAIEGQEVDNFVYEIKIKVTGYRAKKSLVNDFARTYIRSMIPQNKEFVDDVKVEFVDVPGGAMDAGDKNVNVSTSVYSIIDKDSIEEIVVGRSKGDIARYVSEIQPDLSKSVQVKFSPVWARKSSGDPRNIDIKINY